jgi:hypothetical protein
MKKFEKNGLNLNYASVCMGSECLESDFLSKNYVAYFSFTKRRVCVHAICDKNDSDPETRDLEPWKIYARWAPPHVEESDEKFLFCGNFKLKSDVSDDLFRMSVTSVLMTFAENVRLSKVVRIGLSDMAEADVAMNLAQLDTQIRSRTLRATAPIHDSPEDTTGKEKIEESSLTVSALDDGSARSKTLAQVLLNAACDARLKRRRRRRFPEVDHEDVSMGPTPTPIQSLSPIPSGFDLCDRNISRLINHNADILRPSLPPRLPTVKVLQSGSNVSLSVRKRSNNVSVDLFSDEKIISGKTFDVGAFFKKVSKSGSIYFSEGCCNETNHETSDDDDWAEDLLLLDSEVDLDRVFGSQ